MRIIKIQNLEARIGIKSGFVDQQRRHVTPLTVDCIGLTREHLGDDLFEDELRNRKEWCEENCIEIREVEPVYYGERLVGRRFRFSDLVDAAYFRLRFDTDLS